MQSYSTRRDDDDEPDTGAVVGWSGCFRLTCFCQPTTVALIFLDLKQYFTHQEKMTDNQHQQRMSKMISDENDQAEFK